MQLPPLGSDDFARLLFRWWLVLLALMIATIVVWALDAPAMARAVLVGGLSVVGVVWALVGSWHNDVARRNKKIDQ